MSIRTYIAFVSIFVALFAALSFASRRPAESTNIVLPTAEYDHSVAVLRRLGEECQDDGKTTVTREEVRDILRVTRLGWEAAISKSDGSVFIR